MSMIANLLDRAVRDYVSAIEFEPTTEGGLLYFCSGQSRQLIMRLPKIKAQALVDELVAFCHLSTTNERPIHSQTTATIAGRTITFRSSSLPVYEGAHLIIHLVRQLADAPHLDTLGSIAPTMKRALRQPSGLIMVHAPTGTGRSITFDTIRRHLTEAGRQVIDPVDSHLAHLVFRQEPDVLFINDLHKQNEQDLALCGALTGHLVVAAQTTENLPTFLTDHLVLARLDQSPIDQLLQVYANYSTTTAN